MFCPVPGDAPFLVRLGEQTAGLVVADRVDRHLARRRELLDSIPHDRELYECSLTRSSAVGPGHAPARTAAGSASIRCGPWMARRRPHASRPVTLGLVLACLGGTLLVGAVQKAPCAGGDWADGRQYRLACYTDIVPLFGTEQLAGGRLPYLDACAPSESNCDEYPVLTMYFMRVAGWVSGDDAGRFFWVNALLLAVCAARRGELPLPDRSAPRAVVRARTDPGPAGVRELGPARGRPGDGGDPRVLPPPRRMGGRR